MATTFRELLDDFYPYAKKKLGFDKDAKIHFASDPNNGGKMLGKTAHYDPSDYTVTIYTDNRHPKDIMRSISHELVHHAQNCRGDLSNMSEHAGQPGYAQKDEHMREMEREAYEKGNMCFRDWEDGLKAKLEPGTIYESKSHLEEERKETTMSHKDLRNHRLNNRLMESWGYKAPVDEGYDAGLATWMEKFKLHARLPQNQELNDEMKNNAMYAFRQGMDPKQAAEELRAAGVGGEMSDEERRAMYDDEHLSDYDDIYQEENKAQVTTLREGYADVPDWVHQLVQMSADDNEEAYATEEVGKEYDNYAVSLGEALSAIVGEEMADSMMDDDAPSSSSMYISLPLS